ncbi:MAG: transporter substrate-binding domain-containing protein [Motiliproteus sp.]|nr:transporter substrate-binding domain-containing protein [Motiliproteus sp.]MCW9053872.1 transporter substrate-binding domain-containing protein [Motiliproteus sp.]
MLTRLLASLVLMMLSILATAETFRVGVPSTNQAPFIWREDNQFKGIYPDIIELVAKEMGVEMHLVPLPQARLLKHFSIGEIDLEPGVSQRRAENDELSSVSLYSQPFMTVNEVIIYRPTLSFPVFILQDLSGKRVATVRGATVPDYIRRDDLSNELQIAQRVHRGWNDIGLMKEALAIHYQRTLNFDYEISLPYETNLVVFRLHNDQKNWLEPINQAVSRLKQSGAIEDLICKYLCGRG